MKKIASLSILINAAVVIVHTAQNFKALIRNKMQYQYAEDVMKSLFCVVTKGSHKFNNHIAWEIPPKIKEVAIKFLA